MVTKWKITVGLLLILFCGCSQVKELHESSTIISFKEHTDVNADSILELSFLKLQTKDSCLVKNVGLIRELNNCLLILDSANSNLYVFNKSGAYVNQIGQKGSGPGEYILLSSFFVDNNKNYIAAIDIAQDKVLYYNATDFSFLYERRLPFSTSCCLQLEDGNLLWNSREYTDSKLSDFYFVVTDSLFDIIDYKMNKEFKSGYTTGPSQMIYKVGTNVFAYTPFDLTIYRVGTSEIVPAHSFSFEGTDIPSLDFLNKTSNQGNSNYLYDLIQSDYISYYCVEETERDLFVCYMKNKEKYIGLYDKNTDRTYNYPIKIFQDQLKVGELNYFSIGSVDDYHVAPLDVLSLKDMAGNGYVFDDKLSELLTISNEEDNSILLFVRIKK